MAGTAFIHDIKIIGLFGLAGLPGLIALFKPVPMNRPGGLVRLLGLLGLVGFAGFWNPWAGALGGFGAFGLWNHPQPRFAHFAWLGLAGPAGLALGMIILTSR